MEGPPVTVWVDTCVALDFDTTISLHKNWLHAVEPTRLLMQSAAWMAVALDLRSEVSVTAGYEAASKMAKEATPTTQDGWWTHCVAHVVRPYVCPKWHVRHTPDGDAPTNDERDDFMIKAA